MRFRDINQQLLHLMLSDGGALKVHEYNVTQILRSKPATHIRCCRSRSDFTRMRTSTCAGLMSNNSERTRLLFRSVCSCLLPSHVLDAR